MAAKKCIFCETDKLSLEHIYPTWIFKCIDGLEKLRFTPQNKIIGISWDSDENDTFLGKIEKGKDIPYSKFRVKCVCEKCNNTWMSDLENRSKEILKPLFRKELNNTTISIEDARILSLWSILKIIILGQAGIEPIEFDNSISNDIKQGIIPEGFIVEICQSNILYLNYVTNAHPEMIPINTSKESLLNDSDSFYMSGYQVGNIMFRISYLDNIDVHRIQLNRRAFLLHPYSFEMPFISAKYEKHKDLLENPNAELEYLCALMVLSNTLPNSD